MPLVKKRSKELQAWCESEHSQFFKRKVLKPGDGYVFVYCPKCNRGWAELARHNDAPENVKIVGGDNG